MTTTTEYLRWLTAHVGDQEKPRGSNLQPFAGMAGHRNGLAWCASFVVAGAEQTGLRLPPGADTASCALNEAAYKRAGRLFTTPQVGAVFSVYFPSLQRSAHTGVVWKVNRATGRVHTIEGNSNDDGGREGYEVCLRTRPILRATGAVGIRSYGMPYYDAATQAITKPAVSTEDLMAKLDDDDYRAIAEHVVTRQTMALTRATATALGSTEGAGVSVSYLLQALIRAEAEDVSRDTGLKQIADSLAVSVAQLGRNAGTGGIDPGALEDRIVSRVTAAVLDGLAGRLKS